MTRLEDKFNDVNSSLPLERLVIYQEYDLRIILDRASDTTDLLSGQGDNINTDSYIFLTALTSDAMNKLELKPSGKILTNIYSLASSFSARYNIEVMAFSGSVFPPVTEMGDRYLKFNITPLPPIDNMDELQRLLSQAHEGDSVIFVDN